MIGWRAHLGAIFPTPVPGRVVREFYEVVPDGVDITTASLTIRKLSVEDPDEVDVIAVAHSRRRPRYWRSRAITLIPEDRREDGPRGAPASVTGACH